MGEEREGVGEGGSSITVTVVYTVLLRAARSLGGLVRAARP